MAEKIRDFLPKNNLLMYYYIHFQWLWWHESTLNMTSSKYEEVFSKELGFFDITVHWKQFLASVKHHQN